MDRKILGPVTSLVTLMMINGSAAQDCTADTAWQRVRQAYPLHSQTLARCTDQTGKVVVVLTEPPPHLTRLSAPTIVKTLLPLPEGAMQSVQRRRHPLGFDGWAEDLVLVIDTRSGVTQDRLDDSLALLATLAFGSSYKAEIEDIFSLTFTKNRQAPPALEVSKEELFAWLLGPQAHKLTAVDGGSMATLRERAGRNEFGTFYSDPSGLVVAILPRATSGVLNDYVPEIRQFVVDSDVFLGAIRLSDSQVALVGRERTTKLSDVPPLRLETILLLASERAAQMSQSYERRRAFAGKLLTDAGDLFGWDWAPILLSDVLIDTEFGSLLNFTDNMLKSWSESGKISYRGFPHTAPDHFPFGTTGALRTMGTNRLTYNWNTAGVGLISSMGGVDLFTLRNTGSLPISYFPEGSEDNPSTKSKLVNAEDQAYGYFRSLRNPLLARAVQYAALYQTFLTFDVRARRPHGAAPATASMDKVEQVLTQSVTTAVDRLVSSSVATNKEMFLSFQYEELGSAAQHLQSLSSPPEIQKKLNEVRSKISQNAAALDREYGQEWRGLFAKLLAEGRPIPPKLKEQLESVALGLRMVESPENVRRAVVGLLDHSPDGWLKTPSIVLSKADDSVRTFVGGHNIGGRATRVELDAAIPKGEVRASGSYESGRVLRLNPADKDAERDAVRLFDREVGLRDENLSKGTRAVETRLREAPILARPVRAATDALEAPTSRVVRGALSETNAKQVGYRPAEMTLASHPELEAAVLQAKADVVVAATSPAFVVVRP